MNSMRSLASKLCMSKVRQALSTRCVATAVIDPSVTRVGIVGVPFNKGQPKCGVSLGPQAIRNGGLIEDITEFNQWVDIHDYGDVNESKVESAKAESSPHNMLNYATFAPTMKRLSDKVLEVYRDNRMCWTLGGDHSIAVGSIAGHLRHNPEISVFWIDAHTDLNTNHTSMSGNIHGMPVALLAKELNSYWNQLTGMEWLNKKNTSYLK